MTFDQIVALSASLAAALSAIATLWTVREMAKQRQASYRPELVFEGKSFLLKRSSEDEESAPSLWTSKEAGNDTTTERFSVDLINIGLGAAKAVTLTWSFDLDDIITEVNKAAQRSLMPGFIERKGNFVTFKSNRIEAAFPWGSEQINQLDFVLPSESDKQPTKVLVPFLYLSLISMLINFRTATKGDHELSLPKLRVRIDYGDIGEKVFSLDYEIDFEISFIISNPLEVNGHITVARIKKSSLALSLAKEAAILSAHAAIPGSDVLIPKIFKMKKSEKSSRSL